MTTSSSEKSLNDLLYERIILLLQQIKLSHGAEFLNYTLRRHKAIKDFLLDYQKTQLDLIEGDLSDLNKIDIVL